MNPMYKTILNDTEQIFNHNNNNNNVEESIKILSC